MKTVRTPISVTPSEDERRSSDDFGITEGTITSHLPWTIEGGPTTTQLTGSSTTRELGSLRLVTSQIGAGRFRRRARELALTDGEYIAFAFIGSGSEILQQDDRQALLRSGSVIAWDSVRTADCRVPDRVAKHVLFVPRVRFLSVVPSPDLITMRPIPDSSATRMLTSMLDQAASDAELQADIAVSVGTAALELTRAACAQEMPVAGSWDDSALLTIARRYIECHLADPLLDPQSIARELNVSRRRLYEVFSGVSEPVSTYIRRLRLDRAYDEVTRHPPSKRISEIASGLGFRDPAHFARSFRSAFGESPREARRRTAAARAASTPNSRTGPAPSSGPAGTRVRAH